MIEDRLIEINERFDLAMRGANADGLWDWNVLTNQVWFSPRWKSMLGHLEDEVGSGLNEWSDRVHPDDLERAYADVQAHMDGKSECYENIHRVRHKDGHYLTVLDRGFAVRNDSGEVVRMVGTHTDITAQKKVELELQQEKERAEEANRSKSEFLANMSHEIRTPMNGVLGIAELLSTTPLNQEQLKYLDIMQESGKALLVIINDILDFSKVEAGKETLNIQPFNLPLAVERVCRLLQLQAEEKKLYLKNITSPNVPEWLAGDVVRVEQILMNLIGNSIKFTSRGGITVQTDVVSIDQDDVSVQITVEDTGVGVPEDKQGEIFNYFTQADASTTRTYGGTGLGLAISKQLIELMGGTIKIESEPGHGTKFRINLQLTIVYKPDLDNSNKSSSSALDLAHQQCQVLIVEDNKTNQLVTKRLLEHIGCRAEVAENGEVALRMVQENPSLFDLVLMDLQMPVMDGFEASRRIHKDHPDLPIVALTAVTQHEDIERSLAVGVSDVLYKPFTIKEVISKLNLWGGGSGDHH